jgi:hypothetical protein
MVEDSRLTQSVSFSNCSFYGSVICAGEKIRGTKWSELFIEKGRNIRRHAHVSHPLWIRMVSIPRFLPCLLFPVVADGSEKASEAKRAEGRDKKTTFPHARAWRDHHFGQSILNDSFIFGFLSSSPMKSLSQ